MTDFGNNVDLGVTRPRSASERAVKRNQLAMATQTVFNYAESRKLSEVERDELVDMLGVREKAEWLSIIPDNIYA